MDEGLNSRQQLKAAIRRASIESQGATMDVDKASRAQLQVIYQRAHDDIQAQISAAGGYDGTVRLQRLRQLLGQVDARLAALSDQRNSLLLENLRTAAGNGAQAFVAALDVGGLHQIADAAVRSTHHFIDTNGLQLSDKLWRLDHNASTKVGEAIQRAVIMGHGASQATQEFLGRGEEVPADIAAKIGVASSSAIAKSAGAALLEDDGNAYAHALRVFRTEINRAHGLAYRAGAERTPGVIGTKFNLSPRHPRPDICDMYASANLYGLGPGVYPHGKSPWPAHPNTFSFETVVFEDEVTEAHRQGKQSALDWLGDQPNGIQEQVLDSRGKAAALRAGHLTSGMIRAPWSSVKTRLEKKGIDVSKLIAGEAA